MLRISCKGRLSDRKRTKARRKTLQTLYHRARCQSRIQTMRNGPMFRTPSHAPTIRQVLARGKQLCHHPFRECSFWEVSAPTTVVGSGRPTPRPTRPSTPTRDLPRRISTGPFIRVCQTIGQTILALQRGPSSPLSPPLFGAITVSGNRFTHVIHSSGARCRAIFPTIFVRFVGIECLMRRRHVNRKHTAVHIQFVLGALGGTSRSGRYRTFLIFRQLGMTVRSTGGRRPTLDRQYGLACFSVPLSAGVLRTC